MTETGYALDNTHEAAANHHVLLAELCNEKQLARITVALRRPMNGMRAWDVGTGAGHMARSLRQRVGADGYVLATDIETGLITHRSGLDVRVHDIRHDPLPGRDLDLIVVSHLSNHLPTRLALVARLSEALAPGGVLYIEDFRAQDNPEDMVLLAEDADCHLFVKVQRAFLRVLERHRHDRRWPLRTYGAMVEVGLVEVETGAEQVTWHGATAGCQLLQSGYKQVMAELTEFPVTQVTTGDVAQVHRMLSNPATALLGYPSQWTIGRAPYRMPDDDNDEHHQTD
jgi:SAM-dependent methyltransferase